MMRRALMALRRPVIVLCAATLVVAVAACSAGRESSAGQGGSSPAAGATSLSPPATRPPVQRPDGPAADVGTELTGGNGAFLAAAATGPDLDAAGYVQHEYVAAGTA